MCFSFTRFFKRRLKNPLKPVPVVGLPLIKVMFNMFFPPRQNLFENIKQKWNKAIRRKPRFTNYTFGKSAKKHLVVGLYDEYLF
ncbi:hypothetical protein NC651_034451 [Populus alba x Populus x berolinensis]|nr:hypothetical protein NC651_034451 [Populus alba x Populus x berolinensis]